MDIGTERLIGRKEGAIGWVIFNNPARRNAISVDMWEAIPPLMDAFAADPEVRVIVLRGTGETFVAGADISQFEDQRTGAAASKRYDALTAAAFAALSHVQKPTIAMIQGFCIGGGLAVALTADLRIAALDAQFAIPAARLGLGYHFNGLKGLMDLVGPAFAREIMFTARRFSGQEALAMGLLNRAVPSSEVEALVRDYAAMIADNAPLTVRAAKLAMIEGLKDREKRDMDAVNAAVAACFESDDFKEGQKAFLEKRRPSFQGR
ncbi:MAG: enoyl-CoA hydratase [Caulobacteraceae bacterium]|nr:enoyl-CoA hydratase [Caulobacteraceae bacterium]